MYEKIGQHLRALRKRARMTLQELSEQSGLSPSYISKLEAGKIGVSIETLDKIASVMKVDISTLIAEEEMGEKIWVTRANHRDHVSVHDDVFIERLIPPAANFDLSASLVFSHPKDDSGEPAIHKGDHCRYILQGTFKYQVDGIEYTLEQGDSISHPAELPYRWENIGEEEGILLVVSTMPIH